MESPIANLMNAQNLNPAVKVFRGEGNSYGTAGQYPYVATSYRVVEHWQAGAMTRNLPWLTELVPDMFCEISPGLAKAKGIKNGDKVRITSARGSISSYCLVTERVQPHKINGRLVEMVGMVWHFGFGCAESGDSCNQLTPHIGDANTMIPEYKAFLVDIRKEA
jgi:formate dehydrogenase major subunit